MCTLILGRDVLGRGTVVAGANRDEDPARPTDPPGVLSDRPRAVGGRDRVAGGTWLAVREDRAMIALLNRSYGPASPGVRSRGLLTLEVARAQGEPSSNAIEALRQGLKSASYAPFTMVFASRERCWMAIADESQTLSLREAQPGWHVVTHRDPNDRSEPRTDRLLGELGEWMPTSPDDAVRRLTELLALHERPGSVTPRDGAAVCLHQGPVTTVSSTIVVFSADAARYLHAEGRPCENRFQDLTHLLDPEE